MFEIFGIFDIFEDSIWYEVGVLLILINFIVVKDSVE